MKRHSVPLHAVVLCVLERGHAVSLAHLRLACRVDMETSTLFSTPGRPPSAFPWRAPGDVDRAGSGPAARRLFVASPLHEACRLGDAQAVAARLEAGVDVDELDGVRARKRGVRAGGYPA